MQRWRQRHRAARGRRDTRSCSRDDDASAWATDCFAVKQVARPEHTDTAASAGVESRETALPAVMAVVARAAVPVAAASSAMNVAAVRVDPVGSEGPVAVPAMDFDRACDSGSVAAHPGNCPAPAYPATPALPDLRDVVVPARLNHQKNHYCA